VTKPVTVVIKNQGTQTATIGVYLAILPPGGTSNPGGCAPLGVLNWVNYVKGAQAVSVPAGGRVTLKADVTWTCSNPSAVDGQNFTLRAIADYGNDDFGSCDTLAEAVNGSCSSALADDDPLSNNNILAKPLPKVVFVP
jgi:hypothetical protein